MVRSEVVELLASNEMNIQIKEISVCVNKILEYMSEVLVEGGRIEIRGFGSFCLHYRPVRKACNPQTKNIILTKAKYIPHFKPGKDLRERVNRDNSNPVNTTEV